MTLKFALGPLTAIAVADAYLCGFEFLPAFDKMWPQMAYKQHTMWPGLPAGYYSDDTQMTLGVAEWMMSGEGIMELDKYLLSACVRDARGGSPRMLEAVNMALATRNGLSYCIEEKTDGSGAAMRASLFGYYGSEEQVMRMAGQQAALTHGGDGVLAAQAAALMVYLMKEGCLTTILDQELARLLGDERFVLKEKPKGRSHRGMDCVLMALWVLQKAGSLAEILQMIADHGADSDTIGVIAMSAAWFREGFDHDLPHHLWWDLENSTYGRNYLRTLELGLLDSGRMQREGKPMYLRVQ